MAAYKIVDFCQTLFPDGFARTPRLLLRPLQASDAFQLVVLTNDPLVAAGRVAVAPALHHVRRAGADRPVACAKRLFRLDPLRRRRPVCRLRRALWSATRPTFELGFWLGVPHHGKHYGAEAARAMLGLLRDAFPERRIVAECPRENAASWRLLQRLGFCPSEAKGSRKGARLLAYNAQVSVS